MCIRDSVITIYPGTDQEAVIDSKKSGTTLKSGGVLRCQMPGAGGYGNPLERDRALIVHDLEEGYITPESALRDYGLTEEDPVSYTHLWSCRPVALCSPFRPVPAYAGQLPADRLHPFQAVPEQ